jgi:hypothetical protein
MASERNRKLSGGRKSVAGKSLIVFMNLEN